MPGDGTIMSIDLTVLSRVWRLGNSRWSRAHRGRRLTVPVVQKSGACQLPL